MAADDRVPPTLTRNELADVTSMRFVIAEREDGQRILDVVEGEFEQVYRVGDEYSTFLFVALCQREGVKAYRRPRQHAGTVCARTTATTHERVWSRFLLLTEKLDAHLAEATQQFVSDQLSAESSEFKQPEQVVSTQSTR
jgi:hypothetical protein